MCVIIIKEKEVMNLKKSKGQHGRGWREGREGGSARVLRARGVAAGAALAPPSELIYMLPAAPPVVAKATCPCPPWAASARTASNPQVNQGVGETI